MRIADIKETGLDIVCANPQEQDKVIALLKTEGIKPIQWDDKFLPIVYVIGRTYSNYTTFITPTVIISATEFLKINTKQL